MVKQSEQARGRGSLNIYVEVRGSVGSFDKYNDSSLTGNEARTSMAVRSSGERSR